MSDLYHNLTSGTSYLTQHSENPKLEGRIVYENLMAVAETMFGEEYEDEDVEGIIDAASGGVFDVYDANLDAAAAASAICKRWGKR